MLNAGLNVHFIPDDSASETKQGLLQTQVSAGDGVFVLGFPMGLAGSDRNYTIVRQGVIAKISDMLDGTSSSFLIDSFVFPGNSGGPVILKPEIASIAGTPAQNNAFLIGMVVEYNSYIDIAVSQQTHHARVTFEENSGLATVLLMDVINQAIEQHEARVLAIPARPAQAQPNQPAAP